MEVGLDVVLSHPTFDPDIIMLNIAIPILELNKTRSIGITKIQQILSSKKYCHKCLFKPVKNCDYFQVCNSEISFPHDNLLRANSFFICETAEDIIRPPQAYKGNRYSVIYNETKCTIFCSAMLFKTEHTGSL